MNHYVVHPKRMCQLHSNKKTLKKYLGITMGASDLISQLRHTRQDKKQTAFTS